jgi:hypothetical protein
VRTDDLVDLLARDGGAVPTGAGRHRLAWALAAGVLCALLLMVKTLGLNPALARQVSLPNFWIKVGFVAALAGSSLVGVQRLSIPGARLGRVPFALAASVLVMWLVAITVFFAAAPTARADAFFGQSWAACPFLVAMLSAPVFAGVVWAMRGLAPTRLRLAGAAAGLLSGAVGALVYCLHCPELAPPFVGFWYLLGMLIPAGIGGMLGHRLLRW